MKYTELKESISRGANSVYLLEGDDAYFRMKGEEQIKTAFLTMPELNYTSFDGETLKGSGLSALISALKNYPFMAEKRVIRVSEFYPTESEYENYLKPLFEDFPPSSILIIVNSGAKKGVDLKRKHAVTYVDCGRADVDTVARWAYITLRRAGVAASTAACEKVAEYCLCNMARVSVEVEKLAAYKGEGQLTMEEVDSLVYKDADYRLYELTNVVSRRDYTAFCIIADELLQKSGDEMFLLAGLMNYFRNLFTILTSRDGNQELASKLKMKEYGVIKSREQAETIGEAKLAAYISYIYEKISAVKRGVITPLGAMQNAENYIFFS